MDETRFLLFKKLVEVCASQEMRIFDLEKKLTGKVTETALDKVEVVKELMELVNELSEVHFPDPNCDREDEVLNSAIQRQEILRRGKPDPVPFPEDDYF